MADSDLISLKSERNTIFSLKLVLDPVYPTQIRNSVSRLTLDKDKPESDSDPVFKFLIRVFFRGSDPVDMRPDPQLYVPRLTD